MKIKIQNKTISVLSANCNAAYQFTFLSNNQLAVYQLDLKPQDYIDFAFDYKTCKELDDITDFVENGKLYTFVETDKQEIIIYKINIDAEFQEEIIDCTDLAYIA